MLEEAAGTRMYETKKEAALRTLEKKQVKVAEIEKVLVYLFRAKNVILLAEKRHAVSLHAVLFERRLRCLRLRRSRPRRPRLRKCDFLSIGRLRWPKATSALLP